MSPGETPEDPKITQAIAAVESSIDAAKAAMMQSLSARVGGYIGQSAGPLPVTGGSVAKSIFTEAVLIALAPAVATSLCFVNQAAYFYYFGIPWELVSIDITTILIFAITVFGLFKKRMLVSVIGGAFALDWWAAVFFPSLMLSIVFYLGYGSERLSILLGLSMVALSLFLGLRYWGGMALFKDGVQPNAELPNSMLGAFDFVYWIDKLTKGGVKEDKWDLAVFMECFAAALLLCAIFGWHEAKMTKDFYVLNRPSGRSRPCADQESPGGKFSRKAVDLFGV